MSDHVPLAQPEIGEIEEELVIEVLRSGRLSLGPMLERFEAEFANWLGVADVVATSSGTAALHLGVRALGWGRGDEVVLSPFTFVASANSLLFEGVQPVFADVDPVTLNLDPAEASKAVNDKTVGLMPIDIFGYPADLDAFLDLAKRHELGILEDAAQALGAVDQDGRRVGSRGHLTAFAFYANKQMTTGEGGIIVPRDDEEAELLRSERNQGRNAESEWLDHERIGFNYRMSDVAAAIGVGQLSRIDDMLARREAVAGLYDENLRGIEGLGLPIDGQGEARRSWFVYPVTLPDGANREDVMSGLAEMGIQTRAYLPSIHLFPHFRTLGYEPGQFPNAEEASRRTLALPFFPAMTEAQVERVAKGLAQTLGSS